MAARIFLALWIVIAKFTAAVRYVVSPAWGYVKKFGQWLVGVCKVNNYFLLAYVVLVALLIWCMSGGI